MLEAHWTSHGYCVPNPGTYPWLWLWDSCFHAITWAALEDERAAVELDAVLAGAFTDGFVPHMRYAPDPDAATSFWGTRATSSITQPPMYGHAVAELTRRGFPVAPSTVDAATAGLRWLLDHRARLPSGLLVLAHPWESGCDDSPRWDHWRDDPSVDRWRQTKATLVKTSERAASGAPIANAAFRAASVGFNALVAFNARELAAVTGDERLQRSADELADALDARWNGSTWVDDGDAASGSGAVPTLDALLPALLGGPHTDTALAQLEDPTRFATPYGPAGVAVGHPTFDPATYWRGPAWPQLGYLCWVAETRTRSPLGRSESSSSAPAEAGGGGGGVADGASARRLADALVRGVVASGWSEYWNPLDGTGLGASPQSWASLAAVVVNDDVRDGDPTGR